MNRAAGFSPMAMGDEQFCTDSANCRC